MTYSGPDSLPLKSASPQSPSNSGSVSVTEELKSVSPQSPANSVTVVVPAIVAPFMMIWFDFEDMMISDSYSCRNHACIYRHWKYRYLWQLSH